MMLDDGNTSSSAHLPSSSEDWFVLCDDNLSHENESFLFTEPCRIITANTLSEADRAFDMLDSYLRAGFCLCGYFSYELAELFDPEMRTSKNITPLMAVGVFRDYSTLNNQQVSDFLKKRSTHQKPFLHRPTLSQGYDTYITSVTDIKKHIFDGDTYQANYTLQMRFVLEGCLFQFYEELRTNQPVSYGALIHFPHGTIMSRSPELFFHKKGASLICKPMKGTAPRDRNTEKDALNCEALLKNTKAQSENIIIVDLMRNDMGRIADTGTVHVQSLFDIETYPTVHQMTSTITCEVDDSITLRKIFKGLFPCGSVTGAPKIRTMQIIDAHETEPRGVYTGAIGFILPDNTMRFNVPIRTLVFDRQNRGVLGIGGGIIADSNPEMEHTECLWKSRFIFKRNVHFRLIETMLFEPDIGIKLLPQHMQRLKNAVAMFSFQYDSSHLEKDIATYLQSLKKRSRVRVELFSNGLYQITSSPISQPTGKLLLGISHTRVDSKDITLNFKTTNRFLYEAVYTQYQRLYGTYDVLFFNEKDEMTETCRHNIFLKIDEVLYTPKVSCGLLNGIRRQVFMQHNEIIEKVLTRQDLEQANEIILTNAVRGEVKIDSIYDYYY
jgi:para-aminobenzoate synthetase/4-amino-4-deoxychorismate lyase